MRFFSEERYKWVVVGLLWVVTALNYTDRTTIFTVFPVLKREMGVSDIVLALLSSTFLWAYGFFSPLGGYLGDRFSRKWVIIWSLVIFSVVTFATGYAQNGRQLILLRVLLGLSEAIFVPTALAHIATFHTASTRSLANAICLTGFSVGAGIGGFYGGYMADHFTWRIGFYILGFVGFLVALGLVALLHDNPVTMAERRAQVADAIPRERFDRKVLAILKTPTALCMVFLAVAISLPSWPTGTWLPTYLYERFGMTLTKSGLTMALFTYTPALLGSVLGGLWADRWAQRNMKGRMSVQIIGLSFWAPGLLAIGFIATGKTLIADLVMFSIARGILEVNSMPVFSTVVAPSRWSTAYGLYNLAGTLTGSLGVLFVGAMKASWGIGYGLSSTSIILFIAVGVMTFVMFRFLARDIQRRQEEILPATVA